MVITNEGIGRTAKGDEDGATKTATSYGDHCRIDESSKSTKTLKGRGWEVCDSREKGRLPEKGRELLESWSK